MATSNSEPGKPRPGTTNCLLPGIPAPRRSSLVIRVSNWGLLITLIAATGLAPGSKADTLVYVYDDACAACQKFDREIAGSYHQTQESERLPMVKINLADWQSGEHGYSNCQIRPVHGTPTFIQVLNCRERDRIAGYTSDELFWMALNRMVNNIADR